MVRHPSHRGRGSQLAIAHTHSRAVALSVISGKCLPEFDHGGQFPTFRECLTDGRGRRFVDAEHDASMVGRPASGKRRSCSIFSAASTTLCESADRGLRRRNPQAVLDLSSLSCIRAPATMHDRSDVSITMSKPRFTAPAANAAPAQCMTHLMPCLCAVSRILFGRPEIFNTDQGSQFTSPRFTGVLQAAGVRISMDDRGRWMDKVFIERLWRSLKVSDRSASLPFGT